MKRFIRSRARGFQAIGLIVAVAAIAAVTVFTLRGMQNATAAGDAIIKGKVLGPAGTPITFACMYPGTPPPGAPTTCGIGVEVNGGFGTMPSWNEASATDGSFSISVSAGKYQVEFRGPPESIGQYTFPSLTVEINGGETKDLGTITATEKTGKIAGIVKDAATGLPVAGVQVNAFPMFKPEEGGEGGGPKGPMMPIMATTGADGTFLLKVDPGFYGINLIQGGMGPEGQQAGSQYVYSGQPIEAKCETATCNVTGIEILATKADVTIQGDIVDEAGNPVYFNGGVGARPIGTEGFFEYNGPIQPKGGFKSPDQMPTAGEYSIKVPSSTTQYTLTVHTPPDVGYSTKGDVTVTVTPNSTVTKNIVVGKDTSTIFGKVISNSGFALSSCITSGKDKDKFGGKDFGRVFAHNERMGKFADAPIKADCSFTMTLGAGTYRVGHHLNPQAGFINQPKDEEVVVPENTNVEYNITVTAGDATITGQVFDANGAPMRNVWVDAGNEGEARKDFQTGGQEGAGGPQPGEFVGPGGKKNPEEVMKYCLDSKNKKECENFKLPPGASGPGGCTNMLECATYCSKNQKACEEFDKNDRAKPQSMKGIKILGKGAALAKAATVGKKTVKAKGETKKPDTGPDFNEKVIHMGTQTDDDGKFSLSVVSGHVYEVRANLPPDRNTGNLIPPKAVTADLRAAKTASNIVLSFRTAFGTMTGRVLMPNGTAADRCFVHYWNEAGDDGGSLCKSDGTYSLGYSQGKLHVGADSFNGKTPFGTEEQVKTVTTEKTLTMNFQLKERGFDVPSPVSKTFSADEQTTILLDNGTEITVPGGALGESGNVTISASPTVDIKSTESNVPVGAGYTLTATDASGQTITQFNSNVTIKLPYDENYVTKDLGLNEKLLSTAYVDDTTGAFNKVENATQDTDQDKFTILTDHFTDYTIVSPGGVNLKSVKTSASGKNMKITIDDTVNVTLPGKSANWNIGTANFGGAGQLIAVSNKTDKVAAKYRGKVVFYGTDGKLKYALTPIKGFSGGLNQIVGDVAGKSGKAPDGTDDVIAAPATTGPAKAVVFYDIKAKKSTTLTTGTGTGVTTLNTVELLQGGIANLTTLFNDKTAKAWKMSGKLVEAKGKSVSVALTVKNGKVEKKTVTPTVKKTTGKCSTSSSSKLVLKGSGFGVTSEPVILWNASSALAVQSFNDKQISITVNPSAVSVKAGVNTVTIVNADGQAGVAVVTCGT